MTEQTRITEADITAIKGLLDRRENMEWFDPRKRSIDEGLGDVAGDLVAEMERLRARNEVLEAAVVAGVEALSLAIQEGPARAWKTQAFAALKKARKAD